MCKLVYAQRKADHNLSDMHVLICNFLNPTCQTCDQAFHSPMAFEKHLTQISHIKVTLLCHVTHFKNYKIN